ncbi:MAG: winged helix-turn-helix domain-containing protein [Polaromonas sp.]|nr:winged helix-turn-helix domain-containing protein [Polaromonas sp.]
MTHDSSHSIPPKPWHFGPFSLLPDARKLLRTGEEVRLGGRALDVLLILVEHAGQLIPKETLLERVWPGRDGDDSVLRVHIAALRKALGEERSGIRYIQNVPQRGYCFVATVTAASQVIQEPAGTQRQAHALPPLLTRLLGRDHVLGDLVDMLPLQRLVTIAGPGGMGKTTVALAAAAHMRRRYGEGIAFADLSSVSTATQFAGTISSALGMPLRADQPFADLSAVLANRSFLLVLDNCEHLVEQAATFCDMALSSAPQLNILCTSREPLRARNEWVYWLSALPIPPDTDDISYEQALTYPAFELFVERALASGEIEGFGSADVQAISRLCGNLDGIPLAIELVSAQAGAFGINGLTAEFSRVMNLPTLGLRTASARHQTLSATLDWSHDLLSEAERRLFRRLAVFRDRFTMDAALSVAAEDPKSDVATLMSLLGKSLVSADPGGGSVRYRLLLLTRSYAHSRLVDSDDLDVTARKHALWCVSEIREATRDIETLLPARWKERHARKVDDVRYALDWAFGETGDAYLGTTLVAESAALWFGVWMVREYSGRLTTALAKLPTLLTPDAARLTMRLSVELGQAHLPLFGGDLDGQAASCRGIEIARQIGDTRYELRGLWGLFCNHLLRGEYDAAFAATELFGKVAQVAGAPRHQLVFHRMSALCHHFLGNQWAALDHARASLDPSIVVPGFEGNPFQFEHRPAAMTQLARILWLRGFQKEAQSTAREAVEAARTMDHALSEIYALSYGACPIFLWSGEDALASACVEELRTCADGHSLPFWQSWPRMYDIALARRRGEPMPPPGEVTALQPGQLDVLATLHSDFVGEQTVARLQMRQNAWCGPEIERVLAMRIALAHPEHAEQKLRAAMSAAADQASYAWHFRCSASLSRLLAVQGRKDEAARILSQALDHVDTGTWLCDGYGRDDTGQLMR